MIRNVVVHINNEQPLVADLFELPATTDAGLLCTNLRTMDGKRPVFIDRIESTFFFPYLVIRFIEIPSGALARHAAEGGRTVPLAAESAEAVEDDAAFTLAAGMEAASSDAGPDLGDEIDEDFLRRIRDV